MRDFIEELIGRATIPEGYEVSVGEVVKETGNKLGITVRKEGANIAPTFYVDNLYEDWRRGRNTINEAFTRFADILDDMVALATQNSIPENVISDITNWDNVAPRVRLCAASKNATSEFKAGIPFIPIADLAIYFRVTLDDDTENVKSFVVNQRHLSAWGKTITDLLEQGKKNALNDYKLFNMADIPEVPQFPGMPTMLVLTNRAKVRGAGLIACDKVLDKICNNYHTAKLLIIPSSIHELIVLPQYEELGDAQRFVDLIRMVNSTEVDVEEQLSDVPYIYDFSSKEVTVYRGEN